MTDQPRRALEQVSELVRLESGVSLKPTQRRALEAAIRRAAPGEDARGFLERASDPVRGRELVQRLLDEVTIQETAFLRNAHELESIDWHALLQTARERGDDRVRVWAAGCATGEEAYSLAMLARESFGEDPPMDVLATDISKAALSAAEEGRYRRRSVAALERPLLERCFTRDGTMFTVRESLRRPVRFLRHNLVRDPVPPLGEPRFDLVVCRNVLIYFDGPTVERVIGALERALQPSGTLLLGAADALQGTTKRVAEATPPVHTRTAPPLDKNQRGVPSKLLAAALEAADEGRTAVALETTSTLLAENPLNAEAYFVRGMVELSTGNSSAAVESLRRALYVDPSFSIAAFSLGRTYDELAEGPEARRAYEQALRTLDPEDERHEALLAQVDLGDIAAACRARIKALT
jgi:chemotaxis protein methyltransferase CheR